MYRSYYVYSTNAGFHLYFTPVLYRSFISPWMFLVPCKQLCKFVIIIVKVATVFWCSWKCYLIQKGGRVLFQSSLNLLTLFSLCPSLVEPANKEKALTSGLRDFVLRGLVFTLMFVQACSSLIKYHIQHQLKKLALCSTEGALKHRLDLRNVLLTWGQEAGRKMQDK